MSYASSGSFGEPATSVFRSPAGGSGTAVVPPLSLCGRTPEVSVERLVGGLVPPPRFTGARFSTYVPDPEQPSQAEAVRELTAFAARAGVRARVPRPRRRLFGSRAGTHAGPSGIYLDGGYGVGKTHLLAALWHATDVPPQQKAFCTFVELTHLTGALGFQRAVRELSGHRLLCIDEFELDDPGDTVLVSTLLGRLADAGVALAATSNTLPGRLGEGRFAAADFLREIQGLARSFRTLRIDGDDYRHRGLPPAPQPLSEAEAVRTAAAVPGASLDAFPQLLDHLAGIHPSRYGALVDGVGAVCLTGVEPVEDQAAALRLVVLADRLHDRGTPVVASGAGLDRLFGEEMLRGGYRKKYGRALSRLTALTHDGRRLVRDTAGRTAGTGREEDGGT